MSLENGAESVCIQAAWSNEKELASYPAPTRGTGWAFKILLSGSLDASKICRSVPSFLPDSVSPKAID